MSGFIELCSKSVHTIMHDIHWIDITSIHTTLIVNGTNKKRNANVLVRFYSLSFFPFDLEETERWTGKSTVKDWKQQRIRTKTESISPFQIAKRVVLFRFRVIKLEQKILFDWLSIFFSFSAAFWWNVNMMSRSILIFELCIYSARFNLNIN